MTIKNVTQQDEGLYKCASHDRKMESPESWLSVRPDRGQLYGFIEFEDIYHLVTCDISQSRSVTERFFVYFCLSGNYTLKEEMPTGGKIILYC